jgi:flagellar export protein FliJ
MKKFVFRLEAVRRLRAQEEQLIEVELAGVLRDRASVQQELDRSLAAEQDLYEYLRTGAPTAADMDHVARYGHMHRQRILKARINLDTCDRAVNRVRQLLAEARQRREALDRLCERDRELHRKAWLAEQAQELDEIGSIRAARARMLVAAGGAA